MADYINASSTFISDDPNSQVMLYKKTLQLFDYTRDYFADKESKSMSSVIWLQENMNKKRGSRMTFTNRSGLHNEAVLGGVKLTDADYEDLDTSSYSLTLDFIRNQTAISGEAEEIMGFGGELEARIPQLLAAWMGRERSDRLWMMLRHEGGADNYRYAGSANHQDQLTKSDTLKWDAVVEYNYLLRSLAGEPAYMKTDGEGNEIHAYCLGATTDALSSLKRDPEFQRLCRDSMERGKGNPLQRGGYVPIDGTVISEFAPKDHSEAGPIGSPCNPKAYLGDALTDADAADTITGGGNATNSAKTKAKYFRYFPNYAYPIRSGETIASVAEDYYVIIVNPSNAAVDPGKWGMYSFRVNGGNSLTIKAALKSGSDLGEVTWNADKNTRTHPAGAHVILVNKKGVPYGHSALFGAGAALRGYGSERNKTTRDFQDGGMLKQIYIRSVFGQKLRLDLRDRCPGFVWVTHAIQYPGLRIDPDLNT